ncbi:50S ribosomal protein L29 [Auxenochlorella protothecoides]|nr:50S ribosomal protein L29 [Auxenochlorella protothecoides]KFM27034.1 50S ribosomal protein L29 [Auxenochlorella protothecoides]RMZ56381.1 hypothetical protein APUTEX25_004738 [Auxenochlorella protothecoides]|eukprot:RMZ56381.1 hypothetical protein APUTEX25_004738 [Auxenochlorella protothecoides]
MAKPVKASELRNLSIAEIDAQVDQLKRDLFALRIKFAKQEDWKPSSVKEIKHKVAQLLTVRRENEAKEGMLKRESRKAAK